MKGAISAVNVNAWNAHVSSSVVVIHYRAAAALLDRFGASW